MNRSPIVSYVGWLLLFSALGIYGYGFVYAMILSFCKGGPATFPETIATTVSSLQAILLTNLGMLLGISVTNPNSRLARQIMLKGDARGATPAGFAAAVADPLELREKIQLWGLVIYIISLMACVVIWIIKDFSFKPDEVTPLIIESVKMFVGVLLAYVTVVLGKGVATAGSASAGNVRGGGDAGGGGGMMADNKSPRGFNATLGPTNFEFEITVAEGVELTVIDINGTRIEGDELKALEQQAVDRVIKGKKFVPLALETIFFAVVAFGEPNREVSAKLKFLGKDVELDPASFTIDGDTRRGLLALQNIELP